MHSLSTSRLHELTYYHRNLMAQRYEQISVQFNFMLTSSRADLSLRLTLYNTAQTAVTKPNVTVVIISRDKRECRHYARFSAEQKSVTPLLSS